MITLLALVGCNQIIGLDERQYSANAADGGGVSTASLTCGSYCDNIDALCTMPRSQQQFGSRDNCLGVCDKYAKDPAATGNTLACRVKQLENVRQSGEDNTYCAGAGPGGGAPMGEGDPASCASNCDGYCALRRATCKPQDVESDCERKCKALLDVGTFNATADFGSGIDTLQCRIAHLSTAAGFLLKGQLDQRDIHCKHSGIRSLTVCDFPKDKEISCESYCQVVGTACAGDAAVYDSKEQCMKVCAKIPSGTSMDQNTPVTRRCIREGAYDALEVGARLCPSASPGSGRCGSGPCSSFCMLAQQTCPAQFAAAKLTDLASCNAACTNLPGASQNSPYSVTMDQARMGPTFQCRLLRLTRAMEGTNVANNCGSALGLGPECFGN